MVASDKPQTIERLCGGSTLQDGVDQVSKRIDTEGQLLDLIDAYLTVPVHPCHQKYLRFCW